MKHKTLPFRQVHLDFHTSPHIPAIGTRFDKTAWQKMLTDARVNSITLFAKCHHGWSYHPTQVGKIHPHLHTDLLRAQYEACKEAGIAAPIYLSAGLDNLAAEEHPEWREITAEGTYGGRVSSPLQAGFLMLDFLSPYLDYLCAQIEETARLFSECDGIFLDIIHQDPGCSKWRMDYMATHGLDAERMEDRQKCAEAALQKYYRMSTEAATSVRAGMPVFHNSGHIQRGNREVLQYFSHLELESLPTGGWGYDHFPLSAKYAVNLGMDFLGMTGKFHGSWGEFGGQKHPNALRYECAAMLAFNAKCSIGDQLHPEGMLDATTYRTIGVAYREVETKEPWCDGARPVSDLGVLSSEAEWQASGQATPDEGATRALLEGHFLFELVDRTTDFHRFKLLILPDTIRIDDELKPRVDAYLAGGGRLLMTGASGFWKDRPEFAFDVGADCFGPSEFSPDFILPTETFRPDFLTTPVVMSLRSQRIRATSGESLGQVYDPYFNRTFRHFCSHQHTPFRDTPSGFDCGVRKGPMAYLAHPVFSLYRAHGAVVHREYVNRVIATLLDDTATLKTHLPSTARVALNHQPAAKRHVLHLLFANTVARGGSASIPGEAPWPVGQSVEVIEDLLPLRGTRIVVRHLPPLSRVTLAPTGEEIPFTEQNGTVELTVDEFSCHQMVALEHA